MSKEPESKVSKLNAVINAIYHYNINIEELAHQHSLNPDFKNFSETPVLVYNSGKSLSVNLIFTLMYPMDQQDRSCPYHSIKESLM